MTVYFNSCNLDWKNVSSKKSDHLAEAVLDICYSFDLHRLVKAYTRMEGPSLSILHLFLDNEANTPQAGGKMFPRILIVMLYYYLSDTAFDKQSTFSSFQNFDRANKGGIRDLLSFNFGDFLNNETGKKFMELV
ncbi:hypothetical protein HPB48_011477 [Haemaphysalis longicornis]|uniref:Uncharacterized protein n=1 Tax=Haemaphysalis longicornis TaxID=44386 RepID=A0A9J6FCN1_HAELO|nr:hypothetical protein HPB48_011477 [Haemaphysalis longicornis]